MSETAPDGRVERGARNRQRILEALFDLVQAGNLRPTAEQVAERAGVGTRTVFRHFDDMESLYAEMAQRMHGEVIPLLLKPHAEGSLEERVRALVERRAELYEKVAPMKRAGDVARWRSKFLQEEHAQGVRHFRRDLLAAIPEIRDLPDEAISALEMITSIEGWERLRTHQRLGVERARAAVEAATLAILADS